MLTHYAKFCLFLDMQCTEHPFCCSSAVNSGFQLYSGGPFRGTNINTAKFSGDSWQRNEEQTKLILLKPRSQAAMLIRIVSIQLNKSRKI